MNERTRNETALGTIGWIGLAGYVALWDKYAEETLTHAFQRGLDNPKYRPLVLGAMAVTGLHLLRELPRPADPYYIIERTAKLFLPTP